MLPNLNSPYTASTATENNIAILKGSFSNRLSAGTGVGLDLTKQNATASNSHGAGYAGLMVR